MQIPRPVYEALPWLYLLASAVALALPWFLPRGLWANLLFTAGLLGTVAGLTLLLRRRDYRDQQRRYGRSLDVD